MIQPGSNKAAEINAAIDAVDGGTPVEVELAEVSIVTRAANKEAVITSTEKKDDSFEVKDIDFEKISNERLQDLKKSIDKEFYKRILKRV